MFLNDMRLTKIIMIVRRDGLVFTTKRVVAWLIGHSPLAYKLSFPYYKNVRLVFASSMLTYILFASKKERQNDLRVLEEYIKAGDTVVDVGAHIGSMAIVAATIVGQAGRVLTFEPVPKFFNILNANIKVNNLNDIIRSYPYAVGSKSSEVYMDDSVLDDTTNHVANAGTKVTQVTLDEFTHDVEAINFLKIDVEGYELEVLKGAQLTLTKTETIFIEFYTKNLTNLQYSPSDVIKILETNFVLYEQDNVELKPFIYDNTQAYEVNLIGRKK